MNTLGELMKAARRPVVDPYFNPRIKEASDPHLALPALPSGPYVLWAKCSKCHCAEVMQFSGWIPSGNDDFLCSECNPKIGVWHGKFEKLVANRANGFREYTGLIRVPVFGPPKPGHGPGEKK